MEKFYSIPAIQYEYSSFDISWKKRLDLNQFIKLTQRHAIILKDPLKETLLILFLPASTAGKAARLFVFIILKSSWLFRCYVYGGSKNAGRDEKKPTHKKK